MTHSIHVTKDVLKILKRMKREQDADSYNTVLRGILLRAKQPSSLAGFLGKKKDMRSLMRGLRDKDE